MSRRDERRRFLRTVSAAGIGAGVWRGGKRAGFLRAAEAAPASPHVVFAPDIEPLVKLLEETPRDRLLERVAAEIRRGASYRRILASLLLAGVRNVQPRPSVGYKFHAVLAVNSVHEASLSAPAEHRWLPIFWALDYFKSSQAQDVREGDWTMPAMAPSRLPLADKAGAAFRAAMENWDESAADAAIAALARTGGAAGVYELMFRLGARDFRSIGHKAIFAANSWRTLQCIGWRRAEPVLRSLAYALLMHEGDNPAGRDGEPDRAWRRNLREVKRIRSDWRRGALNDAAAAELMATFRDGSPDQACDHVIELLNRGVAPQSIWDAIFVGAGELLVRRPGIVALHAVTTSNALHFAYQTSGDDETRRLLLLQNAAFLPLFRQAMAGRGALRSFRLDELAPETPQVQGADRLNEILGDVRGNPLRAAAGAMAFLRQGDRPERLIDAARLILLLKGDDAHDYKFGSAVFEDYYHISPGWRDRYLAAALFQLHGSTDRDNALTERTRAALAAS